MSKKEFKIENLKVAKKNASGEVVFFEGMDMSTGKLLPADFEFADWVKSIERTEPYTGTSSPKIKLGDGSIVKLGYKFFTDEEKETYQSYTKDHRGSGSSSGSSGGKKGSKEAYDGLMEILDCQDYKLPKTVREKLEALAEKVKPVDPVMEKAKKALNALSLEDLQALMAMKMTAK